MYFSKRFLFVQSPLTFTHFCSKPFCISSGALCSDREVREDGRINYIAEDKPCLIAVKLIQSFLDINAVKVLAGRVNSRFVVIEFAIGCNVTKEFKEAAAQVAES